MCAQAVVGRIANQGDASLESIKMEVEVEFEYIAQGKRLHEEAKEKEEQAMSQEFAITSTRFRADKDDADFFFALYRQVRVCFTSRSPRGVAYNTTPMRALCRKSKLGAAGWVCVLPRLTYKRCSASLRMCDAARGVGACCGRA